MQDQHAAIYLDPGYEVGNVADKEKKLHIFALSIPSFSD